MLPICVGNYLHIFAAVFGILFSCDSAQEFVVVDPLPACESYINDSSVYGYCVSQNASGIKTIEMVQKYCAQTDVWKEDCIQNWVMSQSDRPMKELIEVCGSNYECTFELLDSNKQKDVLDQIKLCTQHAGDFTRDCIMHAMQYWYFTWPPVEEIKRVASQSNEYSDQVGLYIAARVECDGIGSCDGEKDIQAQCERFVEIFKDQKKCPNQHRNRIWDGRSRTDDSINDGKEMPPKDKFNQIEMSVPFVTLTGTLEYSGEQTGTIVLQLLSNNSNNQVVLVKQRILNSLGEFSFMVPESSLELDGLTLMAYIDITGVRLSDDDPRGYIRLSSHLDPQDLVITISDTKDLNKSNLKSKNPE